MRIYPKNVVLRFDDDTICRICLDKGNPDDLIRPCKCSGTIAFVHEECLKTWIKTKNINANKYRCEQCLENLIINKKYPEEIFRLNIFYKNVILYFIEYLFYLCLGFSSSIIIFEIEKLNDFPSVKLLDYNSNESIVYNLLSNKQNMDFQDFYIFYYIGYTGYLFSMIFYFINFMLTCFYVKRKLLFYKLNLINFFISFLFSSHFLLLYFIVYFFNKSKTLADTFVCLSCFFTLFNLPTIRVYSYFHNKNLHLMNIKYNTISIQNVRYNPLITRMRRLSIC